MKYKLELPGNNVLETEDKQHVVRVGKEAARTLNKVVSVKGTENGYEWETIYVFYPNGMVQEGTGGFGFFKNLSMRKK